VKRGSRPPTEYIVTACSIIDESCSGPVQFRGEYAPPVVAEALRCSGYVVDIRAIRVGGGPGSLRIGPEREVEWLITLLASRGGDDRNWAHAIDEAMCSLRDDIDSGRTQLGAHPGRPVVEGEPEPPVEVWLRNYRMRAVCELEAALRKQEQDRQARRQREARRATRRWWR